MNQLTAHAAVSIIITECASPSVLLLKRAKNKNDPWSGQWAFPGGKWEAGDTDLVDTSIRETFEECGCLLSRDDLSMSLPVATAGNHSGSPILVAPFLWRIKQQVKLQLDTTEIEEAKWQEIEMLKLSELHDEDVIHPRYPEKKFPFIMLGDVPLWGFTYGVLMNYLNQHE